MKRAREGVGHSASKIKLQVPSFGLQVLAYNLKMSYTDDIDEIERKVRASILYTDWVERNTHDCCFNCETIDNLIVHHIVDLRAILRGLFKLHLNWEDVFEHAVAMHVNDTCEGVTLCQRCHDKLHSGKTPKPIPKGHISDLPWTVAPRTLWSPFLTGTRSDGPGLRLTAFQTLLGIGWYIINGHVDPDARMIEFNRRRFAELIGKNPGTSFNKAFLQALESLTAEGYILGSSINGNEVEIHLAPRYLESFR